MISKLRLRARASLAVVSAFGLVTLGGDCDGDIVQDPTFRDWCGDSLCAWHLDDGKVQPVPTWNADDLGVSFVETLGLDAEALALRIVLGEDLTLVFLFLCAGFPESFFVLGMRVPLRFLSLNFS